jgi:hypothetical protein
MPKATATGAESLFRLSAGEARTPDMNPATLSRRSLLRGTAALSLAPLAPLASTAWARAENYPTRPVTWVVPYPAGGFGDGLSRMPAQKLSASGDVQRISQPLISAQTDCTGLEELGLTPERAGSPRLQCS